MGAHKRSRWGHIQPIINGEKYRIFWPDGHDDDGERNRPNKIVYGTQDDAEVELARVRASLHDKSAMAADSLVDKDTPWFIFWWLITEPSMEGLEEKTKSEYRRLWKTELMPRIGHDKVSETTYNYVCKVIAKISSSSVQRAVHRLWKKICNQAIHEGILAMNPVDRTVPMKKHVKRKKGRLEADEVMPYLAATYGSRYLPYATALIIGGMRPEEAVPLMSDGIERKGGYAVAHVLTALTTASNKKDYKGTKNLPSERDVYFAEPFATVMTEAAEKANGPLFPGPAPQGREPNETWFAHPDRMRRNWQGWCGRHGMKYIRPLDMRTLYSDLCAEAGAPDSLVDLAMGHAGGDGTTRGRNYMTRTKKSMQLVADMLADYIVSESKCYNLTVAETEDFDPSLHDVT